MTRPLPAGLIARMRALRRRHKLVDIAAHCGVSISAAHCGVSISAAHRFTRDVVCSVNHSSLAALAQSRQDKQRYRSDASPSLLHGQLNHGDVLWSRNAVTETTKR